MPARAEYIRRLFGEDWLDAGNYDLSIDTGRMGVARSVDLIEVAARRRPGCAAAAATAATLPAPRP